MKNIVFCPDPPRKAVGYLTQYKLKRIDSETYKICWLDRRVPTGAVISLKDIDCKYRVVERYGDIEASKLDLDRKPVWYSKM